MSLAPITSLPSNAYLPKSLHKLADEWRAAAQLVRDLVQQRSEAQAGISKAKADDAEAFKAAVLAGKPLPDGDNEKALRDRVADCTRRLPVAEAERDAIGRRLVVALRDDDARQHLADTAGTAVRAALAAYLEVLDDAERKVSDAHRALTDATAALHVVDALDTGSQVRLLPKAPAGVPSFAAARTAAHQLGRHLDALNERKPPRQRHVRLTNGREVHVPASLAADFHRDGQVAEWLDGWPPEKPSTRLAGGSYLGSHVEDFRNAPARFTPRGDAA
ncbi:hypothetical protein H1R13_20800 [Streptomyces mexicanus]|uniref:Uncharacterized protein n=1 Tax=Streptomyces mexicanus TaxID=178566 RepID=A0A7X1I445_9ACTN|nr:hypothetical protein [Streptomyces mexicanus]MBC2867318.1 hypothetical protein [Streptomyces mexicanus]